MIANLNRVCKSGKYLFLYILILPGTICFSFGQQTSKGFSHPIKINESELPDHSSSPDSTYQYVAIEDSSGYHLFSKNLKTGDSVKLSTGMGYFSKVVMSPDGKQLAFEWTNDNKYWEIQIVNIDGSNHRVLYSDSVLFSQLQDWSPDGKYVSAMVFNKDRLFQTLLIPVSDEPVKVLRKQQFKSLNWGFMQCKMGFSDNGKFVAYDISTTKSWYNRDIYVRSIAGGNEIPVVQNSANDLLVGWAPGSKGIVFSSDRSGKWNLYYLPVENGKPQGPPHMLYEDMGAPITVLDFTKDGSLYYKMSAHDSFSLSVASLDVDTKKIEITKTLSNHVGFNTAVQWSRDGDYLAYAFGIGSGYEPLTLAIRSDKSGKERLIKLNNLMRHGGHGFEPQWSSDGKHIIATARMRDYYGPGMDSQGLYEIDINSGRYKAVKTSSICGGDCYWAPLWLNDGRIIFDRRLTSTLILKDLKTGVEKEIYQQSDNAEIRHWPTSCMAVSPDDKQIAFVWAQRQVDLWINKLMMLSTSGGVPQELFATSNGQQISVPAWMPESHDIIFALSKDGDNKSFNLVTINTVSKKSEKLGLVIDGVVPYSFSVHPDGKQIAFTAGKEIYYREETWVLKNILGNNQIK